MIPIKCFTCGMVLADKYTWYLENVRARKIKNKTNTSKTIYLTHETRDKTPEGEIMDELGLIKMCCRRHMLTHVDV